MKIAGLDIGTTGCKCTVFDEKGQMLGKAYRNYPLKRAMSGHEVDVFAIMDGVYACLEEAANGYPDIAGIGITSFGETFVMTDKEGKPLHTAMLYTDPRGREECRKLSEALGEKEIAKITGLRPHEMYSISKIMWIKEHEPSVYEKAAYIFLMEDYVVYHLTGKRQIDYSLATRTMAFDIRNLNWSREIFDAAGIDMSKMSVPVQTGADAGRITKAVAEKTGLSEDVHIVSVSHDQVAAAVGAGAFDSSVAVDGAGTVECLTPIYDEIPDVDVMYQGYFSIVPYVVPGKYVAYAFSYTGGALMQWCTETLAKKEKELAEAEGISVNEYLEKEYAHITASDHSLEDSPSGLLVLPHFAGAATPYMDTGGRNFEYFSEDPLVSSEIAAAHIRGIQSHNVGACPKHFLANNQEYYRMTSNSVIDERALHELYLASFEGAVKRAKPWTIMCSYNKINGTYASEQKQFLTDILRDEWGFDGYVMTDWGALADPVRSIEAGTDLGMPGPASANVDRIASAVKNGILDETVLDRAVERILNIVFRYQENHVEDAVYDFEHGHTVAKKIAEESAVLLKNENAVLPLSDSDKVLVIGEYAKNPRYQGGGSSHINAYRVSGAWEVVGVRDNVSFVQGYVENGTAEQNRELLCEAVNAAKAVDKAIIFAGLPESYETEGLDRRKLDMPPEQNELIGVIAAVQPNTIVVLHNGSPITMPWIKDVAAVLEMYLGGEAVGLATAELLYGEVNPCGHLAETFPVCLEDNPTYPYYGIERHDVSYREGVLVGYRNKYRYCGRKRGSTVVCGWTDAGCSPSGSGTTWI